MEEQPELSVIVAVVSDAIHLRSCLESLRTQNNPPSMEIIVPHDGSDTAIAALEPDFPGVRFLKIDDLRTIVHRNGASREHHDELRARGLTKARGKILALIEDHGRAHPDWARRMVQFHEQPHAAVGGSMENDVDRALNWAIYFSDFGRYQNPLPGGPSYFLTDANVSYKKETLDQARSLWENSFHETTFHDHLLQNGKTLWLAPELIVYQHRQNLSLAKALKERYVWGRSFAGTRAQHCSSAQRFAFLALSPLLPFVLLSRKIRAILQKKRLVPEFMKAFPYLILLTLFWSVGEFAGYWTAKPAGKA
jgi:glycosyltransferase involved in cell wall biosynthesis